MDLLSKGLKYRIRDSKTPVEELIASIETSIRELDVATKIQKESGEWEYWLTAINTENEWHHTQSPLIWKETARTGGRATLIGTISDFWEYCYDYYGLESILPKEDLESLVADNTQFFEAEKYKKESVSGLKIITVMGINWCYVFCFLLQLLQVKEVVGEDGITLRLLDFDTDVEGRLDYLIDMMEGISLLNNDVQLVTTFEKAFENCDMFIYISDNSIDSMDDKDCWYIQRTYAAHMLADSLNAFAKQTIKIIFTGPQSSNCFIASILCQNCTRIKLSNVVAITADLGDCPLNLIAKECNIPLNELAAPPVWGMIDHLFIDLGSIIKKCDIRRPYLRALRTNGGSTLPLGKITSELRYIKYLTDDLPDIMTKVKEIRSLARTRLGRPPTYSNISATIKVIKIWCSNKPSDEIISLGVLSNGCFEFRPGIVVSQPAMFNGKSWTPYKDFPIQMYAKKEILKIAEAISIFLDEFDICKGSVTVSDSRLTIAKRFSV
ncbi:hypothetical protein Trydic_g17195 [Trypoxylus dichotomus]